MTFRDYFENYLVSNGMFEEQAKEVILLAMAENDSVEARRWDEEMSDYPEIMCRIMRVVMVDRAALKWADENCPGAWYREIFIK